MNAFTPVSFAASLCLAACASSPVHNSSNGDAVQSATFTVHVVEASGGA